MTFTERVNRAGRPEIVTSAKDQRSFSNGYQAALRDIAEKLREGEEDAVRTWVENNLAT